MLINRFNDYIDIFVFFFIELNSDYYRNLRICFKLFGMKFFVFEVFFFIFLKFVKYKFL